MTSSSEPLGSLDPSTRALIAGLGPCWAADINRHRDLVIQAYAPLVRTADNAGIAVARDLAYGAAPRQVLDVYSRPEWAGEGRDVVAFFHGGAFVRGSKSPNGAIYDNVAYWFARQGCVALNVEYRLAPDSPYPGGAEDVIAAVRWIQQHIARFGGQPRRLFLMGHSAGGAHVASALFDPAVAGRLTEADAAGALLVSARLCADVHPNNPNAGGVRAYFGEDAALYAARSPASHVAVNTLPVFVAVAQHENPFLDRYGQAFHEAALARARGGLARFAQLPWHNHTSIVAHFNSGEETLGPMLLQFMRDVG